MHYIQLEYLNNIEQLFLKMCGNFIPLLVLGRHGLFDVAQHESGHQFVVVVANRGDCPLTPVEFKAQWPTLVCLPHLL